MVDGFKISGGKKLNGRIKISGSKNSALPIMAATLVETGTYILDNVPNLKDIQTMAKLLEEHGLIVEKTGENSYKIINEGIKNVEAPYELVKTMRASFLVMGPLLSNIKHARVSLPGGCAIGARPVNYHLKGFEKMGTVIKIEHGYVEAKAEELVGAEIYFDFPSVGATENVIMAAVKAKGKTVIGNAAREPEIEDLCNFLNKMGAKISGGGSDTITIEGVEKLYPCGHSIIPDRIEAGTFIIASILTGFGLEIENAILSHLGSFKTKLEEMGIKFIIDGNVVKVEGNLDELKPIKIATMPHPGYPTDLQAQMMLLLTQIKGTSEIKETIFENRFMHVSELNRMGSDINIEGNIAMITGKAKLTGAEVMASDLRAGASLVLAALISEGDTLINRVYHIDRGYEKLEDKLNKVGAEIERVKVGVV